MSRLLALTLLVACGSPPRPQAPAETAPDSTAHSKALSNAKAPTGRTWKVRSGVDTCLLGALVAECAKAFGVGREHDGYVTYQSAGIEIAVDRGRVQTVFVQYIAKATQPFVGSDPNGIGASSTPDEIMHAYGMSPEVSDSVVSKYGEFPGAKDHSLSYGQHGLRFTFYDGKLAFVVIGAPDPAPPLE